MNTNYIEVCDWLSDARREMERDREKLSERIEKIDNNLKAFEAAENLFSKLESQQEELDRQKAEIDSLRAQLQEKEVQLSEQRKLTTGMAKKSSEEDLLKAFRTYANRSKRKTADKRAFAKYAMLEIANANGLVLPEELAATIDSLDDEQGELQIVIEHAEDVIASGGVKNVKIA